MEFVFTFFERQALCLFAQFSLILLSPKSVVVFVIGVLDRSMTSHVPNDETTRGYVNDLKY